MPDSQPSDVSELLKAVEAGSPDAMGRLMPVVYAELKQLAAGYLRAERADHTLQTTGLVHEAYLKLVDQRNTTWKNRSHFFGVAAQAMRRILVDYARKRRAVKRDGGRAVTLDDDAVPGIPTDTDEVLAVDEALERLAALDPRQARIVELRYFAGLNIEETAEALEIAPVTVKRDWTSAKAWLQRELSAGG